MQKIKVADVYTVYGNAHTVMPIDASLEDVVIKLAKEPKLRRVFLVDTQGCFSGEILTSNLMKWVELQFFGDGKINRTTPAREFYNLIRATKASEIARGDWKSLGIKENDDLQTALDKMITLDTNILPVIDNGGKILGDLRLSELLFKTIEVGRLEGK